MDTNFEKMNKILSGLERNNMVKLFSIKNERMETIKEVSIFNNDGSFNQELLTKEGFVNNLVGIENENMKDIYENLYDAIANLDDDGKMSEDELKFIASFGKNSDKNTISQDDFYDLGIIGRDINKYFPGRDNKQSEKIVFMKQSEDIISPVKSEKLKPITAVSNKLKIDGQINEPVIQGNVGDCWLLAGINSLNSTDKGREIIRNSIIPNEDGTVTIKFAGVGKDITITPDEIKKYDTDDNFQDNYSNGDNDALVLEIGVQKLIEENPALLEGNDKNISGGQIFNFWQAIIPNGKIKHIQSHVRNRNSGQPGYSQSSGGNSREIYSQQIKQVFTQALNNKNIIMGFSNGQHAMAITEVKENKVVYRDSMNDKTYEISWDDFTKMSSDFTYTDLSDN